MKRISCFLMAFLMAVMPCSAYAWSKDETVYVKLNGDGNVNYISVVEHLINDLKENELIDESILTEIENLNGFEEYKTDGKGVIWDAKGKDIFYQGKTDVELPVSLRIRYYLNGERKELEEMLGKSGEVKITLDFDNRVKVGEVYTPFVAATTMTFDSAKNSNFRVENGKILENGRTTIVAGVSAPGLYESLGIEEFKEVDKMRIYFETEKFELSDIYSVVMPKLFEMDDLNVFSELDELFEQANMLGEGSQKLADGTKKLRLATDDIYEKIKVLKEYLAKIEKEVDETGEIKEIFEWIVESVEDWVTTEVEKIRESGKLTVDCDFSNHESLLNALRKAGVNETEAVELCQDMKEKAGEAAIKGAEIADKALRKIVSEGMKKIIAVISKDEKFKSAKAKIEGYLSQIDELFLGVDQIDDGMQKLNREGIQTLVSFVNGKVKVTSEKVEKLLELSEKYNNFAGKTEGIDSSVKFVLMVEGVK